MIFKTRDFGEVDLSPEDVIEFKQPPFGFEQYKNYILLHDNDIGPDIVWLQSTEDPAVCFIMFDPSPLSSFYKPGVTALAESLLDQGELVCWVIGNMSHGDQNVSLNLKSPVLINTEKKLGAQVILEQDYPVRYKLGKQG